MVKRKDYFSAILMGTIWTIVCLLLSGTIWWMLNTIIEVDIYITWIFTLVSFIYGIYRGRDFFKVEMRTVRANDPKTDWLAVLKDVQIILIAGIYIESVNSFREGFTWLGLGSFVCGLLLVGLFIHIKNTRFGK